MDAPDDKKLSMTMPNMFPYRIGIFEEPDRPTPDDFEVRLRFNGILAAISTVYFSRALRDNDIYHPRERTHGGGDAKPRRKLLTIMDGTLSVLHEKYREVGEHTHYTGDSMPSLAFWRDAVWTVEKNRSDVQLVIMWAASTGLAEMHQVTL